MENDLLQQFEKLEAQRKRKKVTIALVPIGILILIILILVIVNQPAPTCFDGRKNGNEEGIDCGGNCVACGIKYAVPLEALSSDVLGVSQSASEVAVKIQNNNSGYGAKFGYIFNLFDQLGDRIDQVQGQSFILPNSVKYLIEPKVDVKSTDVIRVEVLFVDTTWFASDKSAGDLFDIFDKHLQLMSATETGYLQASGKLINKTSHYFSKVGVTILIKSKTGRLLHAAKTEISDVNANESAKSLLYSGFPYFPGFQEIDLNSFEVYADALIE